MKGLFLFVGLCASLNFIGQTNGFNLRMAYGLSTSYSNVWEQDSTYTATGFASDTVDGIMYVRLLSTVIDFNGNVLSHKYLGDQNQSLVFFEDANGDLGDNKVVLAGRMSIAGVMHGLIFQLDNNGDTITSLVFPSPSYNGDPDDFSNWISPTSLSPASDGIFYLASQISNENTGNDFAVFAFSSNSEKEWSYIHATENGYDMCRDIKAVEDGVWVSVSSLELDTEWQDVQSFIKLNLQGQMVSEISLDQSAHGICFALEVVEDGIIGITSYEDGSNFFSVPVVFKVDFNGEYIWSSPYPTAYEHGQVFRDLVKCLDGSGFVAVGELTDTSPQNLDLDGSYNWYGLLAKYSNEGETIWDRQYFVLQSVHDKHRVVDLKATSDGGYIFCGESTDSDGQNPDRIEPHQQGWVVKVNGCGCLVPDCDPNCSTKEEEEGLFIDSDQQFVVGPVPADWFINVHVLNDEYLDSRRIEIHNLLGQQVLSYATPTGQATYMIDTQSLSSGIYIVSMTEHGRVVQSEKVEVRKL
jgi:hypothetical protein